MAVRYTLKEKKNFIKQAKKMMNKKKDPLSLYKASKWLGVSYPSLRLWIKAYDEGTL